MKNFCKWILPAMIMAILAAGCATTVQYGDETSSKPISTDFGSSDLQQDVYKRQGVLCGLPCCTTDPQSHRADVGMCCLLYTSRCV